MTIGCMSLNWSKTHLYPLPSYQEDVMFGTRNKKQAFTGRPVSISSLSRRATSRNVNHQIVIVSIIIINYIIIIIIIIIIKRCTK